MHFATPLPYLPSRVGIRQHGTDSFRYPRKLHQNHRFFRAPEFCNWLFRAILLLLPVMLLAKAPIYQEPWGKDSGLEIPPPDEKPKERSIATRIADAIIDFHQNVISPVDGPRSHFRPSSSQYMRQAIYNYGFIKGFIMGCDRLLRENSEDWIYQKVEENGEVYKLDPAVVDKSGVRERKN